MGEYGEFMFNPDNELECERCPANHGYDSGYPHYPCGQQNCWVRAHCDHARRQGYLDEE